jgi:hypothetical protein
MTDGSPDPITPEADFLVGEAQTLTVPAAVLVGTMITAAILIAGTLVAHALAKPTPPSR